MAEFDTSFLEVLFLLFLRMEELPNLTALELNGIRFTPEVFAVMCLQARKVRMALNL